MINVGIDYSMTSPAICVHDGESWSFDNCKFYYLIKKDKHIVINDKLHGSLYPDYEYDPERYDNLSKWSLEVIRKHKATKVHLEGYAFGAVGRVFQIAENTGALKYRIWKEGLSYEVVPPTVIKKFGCGKGNANKEKLWEAFKEETNYNLFNILGQEEGKHWNPVSDMVDSYFICKYGFFQK